MKQIYSELAERMVRLDIMRRMVMCRELHGKELFKGQYPIMRTICSNEGCTQKYLADHLLVTPASIALSVKRLEKSGMIRKATDETNLRCNKIYSTQKGRDSLQMVKQIHEEMEAAMFEGFCEDELRELEHLMGRITENMQKYANISPDFMMLDEEKEK